jgi:hypothetical protein
LTWLDEPARSVVVISCGTVACKANPDGGLSDETWAAMLSAAQEADRRVSAAR